MESYCVCVLCETWSVAPWFIVGWKHSQMAAAHKLLIVHGQQGAGGGQELRMEHNLT